VPGAARAKPRVGHDRRRDADGAGVERRRAGRSLLLACAPNTVTSRQSPRLRASVLGTDTSATARIVTAERKGVNLRAKVGVHIAVQRGDWSGLEFDTGQRSLFDPVSGRALQTSTPRTPAPPPVDKGPAARLGAPARHGAALDEATHARRDQEASTNVEAVRRMNLELARGECGAARPERRRETTTLRSGPGLERRHGACTSAGAT